MIEYKVIEAPYYKKISGAGPDEVSFFGASPGKNYEINYRPAIERNENGRITYHGYPGISKKELYDRLKARVEHEEACGKSVAVIFHGHHCLDDAKKEAAKAFAEDSEDSAVVSRNYRVRDKEVTINKKGNVL